ncbi:MAG: SpoIIE family protein phosphatase, partial [Sporichthyaceae bacterium]
MLDVEAVMSDQRNAHPDDVGDLLARAAAQVGTDVTLYLVDFGQVVLQPVPSFADPQVVAEENVTTSLAGRAFTTGTVVTADRPDGVRVWVPVFEQSVRAGVLALTVDVADERTLDECRRLSDLAGLLVAGAAPYTDLMHVRRRGRGMTLAASMQWDLLPPLTLRSSRAVVTGLLEPAYEVAGDAFDYAMNGLRLDVAILDGMGHGIGSTLLSTLAVGSYRHARRDGLDLPAMHAAVDAAVESQYEGDAFVTGILARLRLDTGELAWSCAGHPVPL